MASLDLHCTGMPEAWSAEAGQRLAAAAAALQLDQRFESVEICADDLGGHEGAWCHFAPGVATNRPRLTLFCPLESFGRQGIAPAGFFATMEVWEQQPIPHPGGSSDFSADQTDRFVHHQLLLARDLADGLLRQAAIPDSLVEAMLAAWSVTVDGRLRRYGLPGYDLSYRRGRFSRLFSGAGVLLPGHWEIFQALWEGAIADFPAVLSAVRQLPRL